MTQEQFSQLQVGDVVSHLGSHSQYRVMGHAGGGIILVEIIYALNPAEWKVISTAKYTYV